MIKPQRLQLSRRAGFNLQRLSREVNGLPAVNCARPSKYGNQFRIGGWFMIGDPGLVRSGLKMSFCEALVYPDMTPAQVIERTLGFTLIRDAAEAVAMYRRWAMAPEQEGFRVRAKAELKGKNLACFCGENDACHVDVLLEVSNSDED